MPLLFSVVCFPPKAFQTLASGGALCAEFVLVNMMFALANLIIADWRRTVAA